MFFERGFEGAFNPFGMGISFEVFFRPSEPKKVFAQIFNFLIDFEEQLFVGIFFVSCLCSHT